MANRRQPTAVRALHGARPGRLQRVPAPEADGQAPPRPEWLNGPQRELWAWYERELRELGLLRRISGVALVDLVVGTYVRDNAAAIIAAEGITAEGRREGEVVKHPALYSLRAGSEMIRRACRDLGIIAPAAGPVPPDPEWKSPARLFTTPV